MSIQSDRTTNQPLGTSLAVEAAAAVSRKPWATPMVIVGTMAATENAGGGQSDGATPS